MTDTETEKKATLERTTPCNKHRNWKYKVQPVEILTLEEARQSVLDGEIAETFFEWS